jgi:hypothetical protein
MSLTKEKILKNAKKFHETGVKLGFVNDELMGLLGEEFISAPATTNSFNAFDGGLILHILNTTKYAISFNDMLPEDKKVNQDSLIKVCFLHQLGKAKMFTPQTDEWRRTKLGELYTFTENTLSMKVAERSIYFAMKGKIDLTEDEVFAIFNYNEDFSTRPIVNEGEKLAGILRIANQMAMFIEK